MLQAAVGEGGDVEDEVAMLAVSAAVGLEEEEEALPGAAMGPGNLGGGAAGASVDGRHGVLHAGNAGLGLLRRIVSRGGYSLNCALIC